MNAIRILRIGLVVAVLAFAIAAAWPEAAPEQERSNLKPGLASFEGDPPLDPCWHEPDLPDPCAGD